VPEHLVIDRDTATQIRSDLDIVTARSVVRDTARTIGFGTIDQARIATAVSEIARMIFLQFGIGQILAREIVQRERHGIEIEFHTQGTAGTQATIAAEQTHLGPSGARRLVDEYDVRTRPDGSTVIVCRKWCP
jgi:serine/threonine-protein kinase RsbT